ncbi:hypothetical protein RB599_010898 [Gaeumannomyces hyphopodioides]
MGDHSLPSYPPGYTRNRGGLADTINTRYRLRYRKWNFVVFRGTYEDDALWARFVALLKDNYAARLEREEAQDELGPDLKWTIIEDKALEGASRDAVRARFLDWVAARSDERDGPGAGRPGYPRSARASRIHWYLRGQVVVIDGTHGHHDKDPGDEDEDEDEGYEPLEGNPAWDVGWTYVDAGFLTGTYESLHLKMTDWETWGMVYERVRPLPEGPKRGTGEPLAAVDLLSSGED